MSPLNLLAHAVELLAKPHCTEADRRRAISAAYYALFNALSVAAAETVAHRASAQLRNQVRRSFGHGEIKKACLAYLGSHSPSTPQQSGHMVSRDIFDVCLGFKGLHLAREDADYDLSQAATQTEAVEFLELAFVSVELWDGVQGTEEAASFIATLYLMGRRRG